MKDVDSPDNQARKQHHNLLLITPEGGYQSFASERHGPDAGRFLQAPQTPDLSSGGTRKVLGLARQGSQQEPRGPAFAILPIKPEPAGSACGVCYLVNTENLNEHNPWVNSPWSDNSIRGTEASAAADHFEVLIAGPAGKVYHVRKDEGAAGPSVSEVELDGESEIWSQLRNGCIAGSANYLNPPESEARVVPLVNVASLVPAKSG